MTVDEAPQTVELDEEWLAEWIAYGLREMNVTLERHARFAAWLETHHRQGEEDGEPSQQ